MAVDAEAARKRELALQRAVRAWILTGLTFMLLPGTFLGVWNLIAISGQRTAADIPTGWIQAHGHAQVFGWIGTFILGVGFYSLSKMAGLSRYTVGAAWVSWVLWSGGVLLRWATNLYLWQWRAMLPVSAVLELTAFLLFFRTVAGHRPPRENQAPEPMPGWMRVVIAGTVGFLASLAVNLAVTIRRSLYGDGPAIPTFEEQRLLALFVWTFPVMTIWGFSSRWLRVFLGLRDADDRMLMTAVGMDAAAVIAAFLNWWVAATTLFLASAALSAIALRVFTHSVQPAKTTGVHSSFPDFVRAAYVWLNLSGVIAVAATLWDRSGGFWGASRHALTVGFIATMVFAVGQRVLPAFSGMRLLFSPALMFGSLAFLTAGCAIRVVSEIGAYEGYVPALWSLLPLSALCEMTAVTLFALNLVATMLRKPAHVAAQAR